MIYIPLHTVFQVSLTESQLEALHAEARGLSTRLASARTRDGALGRRMHALRLAERQAEAQRQVLPRSSSYEVILDVCTYLCA